MRALVPALAAVALAASAGGAAAADPACGGATTVASSCELTFSGATLFFHAQNVRVVGRGTVLDDTVTITVDNLTRGLRVASCTATAIAAGCGATVNPGPRLGAGDLIRCTVSQWGAVTSVYNCS